MISFIVPVFNEEESLEHFYSELVKVIPELSKDYEILFIDDGSTDNSLSLLKNLAKKDKTLRVYSFRRNLGKAEALTFGFGMANGDYIITLDADLQDKPSEISKLLDKVKNDHVDLVSGWRKDRKDKKNMVTFSRFSNRIIGKLFGLSLHDYNCGLKVYTKDVAKGLRLYGGMHRFIPLIAYQNGFVVEELAVEHAARRYGKSKYNFSKYFKDLPDIFSMLFLIKFKKRPLHFFGMFGAIFSFIGLIILAYFTIAHTFYHVSIGGRPLLYIGLLLVIAGFQIFFTGFLADLLINISQSPRLSNGELIHFPLKYASDKA